MPAAAYSISDLARLTGLSVRTIRYYLAQGLIPASGESGPGAHYGDGHLGRLRLVRRLQQQHQPLAEIRGRLAALTDREVAELAGEPGGTVADPETSALDYVRAVLSGAHGAAPAQPIASQVVQHAPAASMPATQAMPAMRDGTTPTKGRLLRRMAQPFAAEARAPLGAGIEAPAPAPEPLASEALAPEEPDIQPPSIERSQWERLSLGPNLELHVRRPLGRLEQKRVERLVTIARQVLKEEQP